MKYLSVLFVLLFSSCLIAQNTVADTIVIKDTVQNLKFNYKQLILDGTPLGSKSNEECRIDSISQNWSVLSEEGNEDLIHTAMDSAYKYLIQKHIGIIKLLDPAFDKSKELAYFK